MHASGIVMVCRKLSQILQYCNQISLSQLGSFPASTSCHLTSLVFACNCGNWGKYTSMMGNPHMQVSPKTQASPEAQAWHTAMQHSCPVFS